MLFYSCLKKVLSFILGVRPLGFSCIGFCFIGEVGIELWDVVCFSLLG